MIGTVLVLAGTAYIGYRVGDRHAKGESVRQIVRSDIESAVKACRDASRACVAAVDDFVGKCAPSKETAKSFGRSGKV